MKVQPLLERWQAQSAPSAPKFSLPVGLDLHDAARLRALAEMYPGCTVEGLAADLLQIALDDLEAALPYVNGPQTGVDELGDPVYADIGPTPRFLALTRQHLRALSQAQELVPS